MAVDWTWKLVYHDGSTFSNLDGEPHESPPQGVLFVVQPDHQPPIALNADWFMWRKDLGQWTECGADGLADQACLFGHLVGCWRKTLWIPTRDFKALWAKAREELER